MTARSSPAEAKEAPGADEGGQREAHGHREGRPRTMLSEGGQEHQGRGGVPYRPPRMAVTSSSRW